jgi:hypothetical protein
VFDPSELTTVRTLEEIKALPRDTDGIFVRQLTDEKVHAIVGCCPQLRHLICDGNNRATDASFLQLKTLPKLESLDLEWSLVTDAGVRQIADMSSLQWVDLGFCEGVHGPGIAALRRTRPELKIEWHGALSFMDRVRQRIVRSIQNLFVAPRSR